MKFRNASIKQKLTLLMVLVSTVVLVLVAGAMMVIEVISFRQAMVDKISGMAEVVADNSAAAVILNKKHAVEEALEAFSSDRSIRAAFVFRDQKPFAYYLNASSTFRDPDTSLSYSPCTLLEQSPALDSVQVHFTNTHLGYLIPVRSDGKVVGRLYVQSGLDELNSRLVQFSIVLAGVLLVSIFLSLLLARRLQNLVTNPMFKLFKAMDQVSQRGDFSIRVHPESQDEVGTLMTGFNQMLEQLELRDSQLLHHQQNLEEKVVQRTEELMQANVNLTETIAELEVERDRAEAANRAKSQFLANMSHEIRTPMIGVLGMTELLFNTGLTEKQRQLAQTVFNSGEALLEILNDLLDFSKIEAGKLALVNTDFDLRETVEEVVGLLAENAAAKDLELLCTVSPGIPLALHGDAGRLRQILLNLVGNAIKFTEKGEVTLRVEMLFNDDQKAGYAIEVEDTGIGIDRQAQDAVFDSFSQADEAMNRKFGGTGLGLAIVRQLVSLMQGEISLDSTPGVGSCFRLELQFSKQPESTSHVNPIPVHLHGKRILVVEDHEPTAAMLEEKLLSFGFRVDVAENGREALSMLRQEMSSTPYSLAFLDADMAGLGGRRLAAAISGDSTFSSVRMVMMCSPKDMSLGDTASLPQIVEWLYKPIRPSRLAGISMNALQSVDFIEEAQTGSDQVKAQLPEGWRILLVEDNPTTRDYVKSSLSSAKGHLLMAHNGQEALELLQAESVDLVLMDCQMPVMDGFEATRVLREQGFVKPIIALTARAFKPDVEACLAIGMNDHLCKPFRQDDLFNCLAIWLQSNREHRSGGAG